MSTTNVNALFAKEGGEQKSINLNEYAKKIETQNELNNLQQNLSDAEYNLGEAIQQTNDILVGVGAVQLIGALLTRAIGGYTPVAKTLFDPSAVFVSGKTIIYDITGTIGIYAGDIDSATVEVTTIAVSPDGSHEPTGLGTIGTNAELPQTIGDAETLGWQTPDIGDYAIVLADETQDNLPVEWYIVFIDGSQNIQWGNPRVLNLSDYQAQTDATMAGKVLTGGATAGTFGESLGIDTVPTENSGNLVTSGAVFDALPKPLEVAEVVVAMPTSQWLTKVRGTVTKDADGWGYLDFYGQLAVGESIASGYPLVQFPVGFVPGGLTPFDFLVAYSTSIYMSAQLRAYGGSNSLLTNNTGGAITGSTVPLDVFIRGKYKIN